MIHVRKALPSDIDTLLEFEQGVIEAERPFDETLRKEKIYYYDLKNLIESDKAELVVALDGEKIVGSGYAKILPAKEFQQFSEYAYLGFMYVRPEYRGRGINSRVLDHLERWAAGRGLTELRLEVYAGNTNAIRAYEKTGFAPVIVEMRKSLIGNQ